MIEYLYVYIVNRTPRTERPAGYRAGRSALATPRTVQREIAPCVSQRVTVGYQPLTAQRGQYQRPITTARGADVVVNARNVNHEWQRTGAVTPLRYVGRGDTALRTYKWVRGA
jgi:hypothetical protein